MNLIVWADPDLVAETPIVFKMAYCPDSLWIPHARRLPTTDEPIGLELHEDVRYVRAFTGTKDGEALEAHYRPAADHPPE